ncbi:jg12860 [Pararge aegeria aegeria]|uniref:Jg12860 protein n=1 Tax=Pararge aegeria aegeria TaxID=348720 RepID=A0A8S4S9R0_9NEOP|nr:jg12860 [Pararge aegeria aegeria]
MLETAFAHLFRKQRSRSCVFPSEKHQEHSMRLLTRGRTDERYFPELFVMGAAEVHTAHIGEGQRLRRHPAEELITTRLRRPTGAVGSDPAFCVEGRGFDSHNWKMFV